jgi:hypothetical protein
MLASLGCKRRKFGNCHRRWNSWLTSEWNTQESISDPQQKPREGESFWKKIEPPIKNSRIDLKENISPGFAFQWLSSTFAFTRILRCGLFSALATPLDWENSDTVMLNKNGCQISGRDPLLQAICYFWVWFPETQRYSNPLQACWTCTKVLLSKVLNGTIALCTTALIYL